METTGEASADGGSSGSSGNRQPPVSDHRLSVINNIQPHIDDCSQTSCLLLPTACDTAAAHVADSLAASVPLLMSSVVDDSQKLPRKSSASDEKIYVSIPTCRFTLSSDTVDVIFSPATNTAAKEEHGCASDALPADLTSVARRRPAVLTLNSDVFGVVASFCDDRALLAVGAACKALHHAAVRGVDTSVWRSRCTELWQGKLHFCSSIVAASTPARSTTLIPEAVSMRLARATTLLRERPPPPSLLVGLAHSWRSAYFVSKADAKRDFLTDDELFEFNWSVRFTRPIGADAADAAEAAQRLPPTQVFRRIGRRHVVRAAAFLPEVPCQLYDGGRRVQVDIFPAHTVQRDKATWGWKICNAFVTFASAAVADAPATPPASPAPPPNCDAGTSLLHVANI